MTHRFGPLIPTDSTQRLAAVATGSTVLGSSHSELALQPVYRCLPDCAYPFETSLRFTLNCVGLFFSATLAAHLSLVGQPPWNVVLSSVGGDCAWQARS